MSQTIAIVLRFQPEQPLVWFGATRFKVGG
jgi:hypothetical protein